MGVAGSCASPLALLSSIATAPLAQAGGATHPALCHLYCHALELSPYPEKALPAGRPVTDFQPV